MNLVGLVAIGRNEGKRLHQCLTSAIAQVSQVVYVDSGSTDGSLEFARSLGVHVVELDLSIPFTAARARNEGAEHILTRFPHIEFIQFVDGDCELVAGWIEQATHALAADLTLAVVCGRRRERYPEQSVYNRICDIEWNTPIGETKACGGDATMRATAFRQVGGFNPTLIAGEEPELCVRLRQQGWKILRIDAEMTLHDAQMTQFHQWWKRSRRGGHAYAEGAWMHGRPPEHHWVKESRSIWFWGLILPIFVFLTVLPTKGLSLGLLLGYPWLMVRTYRYMLKQGCSTQAAAIYSMACVIGKFSQVQGQIQFHLSRILGKQRGLIEYKN